MKTEADIAACLGTQGCIVYAQAFSTISSVIPAFCKRGDIIIADKLVNYSIRKGLEASRSNILWYNHNDMEDLERQMQKVVQQQAKKKLTRRFVVTEALFDLVGDSVNLPKLVSNPIAHALPPIGELTRYAHRSNSRKNTSSASASTRHGRLVSSAVPVVVSPRHRTWMPRRLT